jgi:hypothetical protein
LNFKIITTATKAASVTLKGVESMRMKMDVTNPKLHDWRYDLARDGAAVVEATIPPSKALDYAYRMYSWLEGLQETQASNYAYEI